MTQTAAPSTEILDLANNNVLETVLAHSNAGVAIFNTKGVCQFSNAAFATMLEHDAHVGGHFDLEGLAPWDRASTAHVQFERLRADKISDFRAECQILNAYGRPVWMDLSVLRIQDQIILQIVNIDMQKSASAQLASNEARWETALEAANQGVWEFDMRTAELTFSRGWRRMRGMADDEIVGTERDEWLERVHPDDHERIYENSAKQGQGEDGFDTIEYRERHRDGHYIWIYSRGRPYEFDADGNPTRAIGTDTDITQLKTIEAELAVEKERLRVTLQSIGDGVITTDAEAHITFLNDTAEQMTGWTMQEALGQHVDSIFKDTFDHGPEAISDSVTRCLTEGVVHSQSGYSKLRNRNGEVRFVRESAAPVRTEDGEIIGAVMVFQDSTQRHHLQMELEHSATHDSLTGLPNRAAFDMKLTEMVDDARANDNVHALGIIDLDRFKAVNDTSGHAAGDALLKVVTKRIRGCMRNHDFAARIGGDEFGLVLHNCDLENARIVGQKIVDSIAHLTFEWRGQEHRIGASIGFTTIRSEASNADRLYRRADEACYNAKAGGRGQVAIKE